MTFVVFSWYHGPCFITTHLTLSQHDTDTITQVTSQVSQPELWWTVAQFWTSSGSFGLTSADLRLCCDPHVTRMWPACDPDLENRKGPARCYVGHMKAVKLILRIPTLNVITLYWNSVDCIVLVYVWRTQILLKFGASLFTLSFIALISRYLYDESRSLNKNGRWSRNRVKQLIKTNHRSEEP